MDQSDDSPDEWEDEVVLMVELKGLPNSEEPIPTCRDTCTILGIDSSEPMLQLDQYLFKGSYEEIIGTAMVFEQGKGNKLKYVCKTNKKLVMSRVILKRKETPSGEDLLSEQEGVFCSKTAGPSGGQDTEQLSLNTASISAKEATGVDMDTSLSPTQLHALDSSHPSAMDTS